MCRVAPVCSLWDLSWSVVPRGGHACRGPRIVLRGFVDLPLFAQGQHYVFYLSFTTGGGGSVSLITRIDRIPLDPVVARSCVAGALVRVGMVVRFSCMIRVSPRVPMCPVCTQSPPVSYTLPVLIDMVVGLAHFAPIAAAPPPLLWRRCAVTSCARQVYDDGPFAVAPMMCAQLLERLAPMITVLTIGLDTFPFFSVSGTTRIVSFGTCCACSADGPRCTRRW